MKKLALGAALLGGVILSSAAMGSGLLIKNGTSLQSIPVTCNGTAGIPVPPKPGFGAPLPWAIIESILKSSTGTCQFNIAGKETKAVISINGNSGTVKPDLTTIPKGYGIVLDPASGTGPLITATITGP